MMSQNIAERNFAWQDSRSFYVPPFENLQCSPIGLVPKKEINEFYLIHHYTSVDDDHESLGIQFKGSFYYEKGLPIGCSISCSIFESFSTALQ